VPLAVQAPSHAETWAESADGPPKGHAYYAQALLDQAVFAKSPALTRRRSVFVGVSAGSTFLSGDFLPAYGQHYGGGAVLLCGGGRPLHSATAGGAAVGLRFLFMIQRGDFLYAQTLDAVNFWEALKVPAELRVMDGSGHCAFDTHAAMLQGIRSVLSEK